MDGLSGRGQVIVIGATNRLGEYATERPVKFQEVWATLYQNLGLNLRSVREFDLRGRPQYLVDEGIDIGRRDACLLRFLAGIDLDVAIRPAAEVSHFLG